MANEMFCPTSPGMARQALTCADTCGFTTVMELMLTSAGSMSLGQWMCLCVKQCDICTALSGARCRLGCRRRRLVSVLVIIASELCYNTIDH